MTTWTTFTINARMWTMDPGHDHEIPIKQSSIKEYCYIFLPKSISCLCLLYVKLNSTQTEPEISTLSFRNMKVTISNYYVLLYGISLTKKIDFPKNSWLSMHAEVFFVLDRCQNFTGKHLKMKQKCPMKYL